MEITEELQELISSRVSTRELKRKAVEQGMVTLHRSGLIKVAAGLTSLEEVVVKVVL
jgi:type IV pilus assembly protein PilB